MILVAALAAALAASHPTPNPTMRCQMVEAAHFSPAPGAGDDAKLAAATRVAAEAKRVAAARGVPVTEVRRLMLDHTVIGDDGRPMVDVVALNAALDQHSSH